MIETVELLCAFYCNYITNTFNYTDNLLLPAFVFTNVAQIFIRNVFAAQTKMNFFSHFKNNITKNFYIRYFLFLTDEARVVMQSSYQFPVILQIHLLHFLKERRKISFYKSKNYEQVFIFENRFSEGAKILQNNVYFVIPISADAQLSGNGSYYFRLFF